jgi:predicted nucleotide-binding protein
MTYTSRTKDAVIKRAEMVLRKIFGEKSIYIKNLHAISYSPKIVLPGDEKAWPVAFKHGKRQLVNLLKVAAEEYELDAPANESEVPSRENTSNKVFVVHGKNEEMKQAVARMLEKLNLEAIVLHEQPNKGRTIIEKFTDHSEVGFAVVLLSADDIAYAKDDDETKKKYRARQNVIFELGFFLGKIGRKRVIALHQKDGNLEIPSDYAGVIFIPFDGAGKWKLELVRELKDAGLDVDANRIL